MEGLAGYVVITTCLRHKSCANIVFHRNIFFSLSLNKPVPQRPLLADFRVSGNSLPVFALCKRNSLYTVKNYFLQSEGTIRGVQSLRLLTSRRHHDLTQDNTTRHFTAGQGKTEQDEQINRQTGRLTDYIWEESFGEKQTLYFKLTYRTWLDETRT